MFESSDDCDVCIWVQAVNIHIPIQMAYYIDTSIYRHQGSNTSSTSSGELQPSSYRLPPPFLYSRNLALPVPLVYRQNQNTHDSPFSQRTSPRRPERDPDIRYDTHLHLRRRQHLQYYIRPEHTRAGFGVFLLVLVGLALDR